MRSKARRMIGKYFVPEGDSRRVQPDIRPKKRSFDKSRSFIEDRIKKIRKRSKDDYVPGARGETIYEDQDYTRGGGKRKRRKTQRKPRKTRRTKRRTRKSRR